MPEEIETVVIDGREPRQLIVRMLQHLRSFGPQGAVKASWIEDVYSEVLKGLEQRNLRDPAWIDELIDTCSKQLNAMALVDSRVHGLHFGEIERWRWGWSQLAI